MYGAVCYGELCVGIVSCWRMSWVFVFFFFQAEDGIRDHCVTGVQTCALPICIVDYTVLTRRLLHRIHIYRRYLHINTCVY